VGAFRKERGKSVQSNQRWSATAAESGKIVGEKSKKGERKETKTYAWRGCNMTST